MEWHDLSKLTGKSGKVAHVVSLCVRERDCESIVHVAALNKF